MQPVIYCLIGGLVLLAVIFLATALKIVPEYKRLVVFGHNFERCGKENNCQQHQPPNQTDRKSVV